MHFPLQYDYVQLHQIWRSVLAYLSSQQFIILEMSVNGLGTLLQVFQINWESQNHSRIRQMQCHLVHLLYEFKISFCISNALAILRIKHPLFTKLSYTLFFMCYLSLRYVQHQSSYCIPFRYLHRLLQFLNIPCVLSFPLQL